MNFRLGKRAKSVPSLAVVCLQQDICIYKNHRCSGPSAFPSRSAILSPLRPGRKPIERARTLNGSVLANSRRMLRPIRKNSFSFFEGFSGSSHFFVEFCDHVIIKSQCCSHDLMLSGRHHDGYSPGQTTAVQKDQRAAERRKTVAPGNARGVGRE